MRERIIKGKVDTTINDFTKARFWTVVVSILTSLGIITGFIFWLTSINESAQAAQLGVIRVESALTLELTEIKELLWEQNERLSRIEGKLD